MAIYVKFWGTRGSIPTPGFKTQRYGGNTSCVEIQIEDRLFICDGGTGLRELGKDLMERNAGKGVRANLLFSHAHWDHIQGFPFFTPAYLPDTQLKVYGAADAEHSMYELLSGQMTSKYFPVHFKDLGGHITAGHLEVGENEIDEVKVRFFRCNHPGGSVAYSFEYQGKKVVYATDNELDQLVRNPTEARDVPTALRRLPRPMVEFCRGADVLIADGQYTDDEYPKYVGWGHSRASTTVDLASAADVQRLVIFHHDPMQNDAAVEAKVDACRERGLVLRSGVEAFAAREGVSLKV